MKAGRVALFAVITAVVCLSPRLAPTRALEQHLGPSESKEPTGITQSDIEEIVSIVHQEGMLVNFELLCAAIGLAGRSADCRFRQLAVHLESEHADVLAFNVPADAAQGATFVIVFHTARDLAEIYLVSMRAELLRAYVMQPNGRFEQVEHSDAKDTFLTDLAYWSRHLTSFYDSLGLERPPHRR